MRFQVRFCLDLRGKLCGEGYLSERNGDEFVRDEELALKFDRFDEPRAAAFKKNRNFAVMFQFQKGRKR